MQNFQEMPLAEKLKYVENTLLEQIQEYGLKHEIMHDLNSNIEKQVPVIEIRVFDPTPMQQTNLRHLANSFDRAWTVHGDIPIEHRLKSVGIYVEFTPASDTIIRNEKARIAEMELKVQDLLNQYGLKGTFEVNLSFPRGIGSSSVICRVEDALPEQAKALRQLADSFSYGRNKERLPQNDMQIYQFSIVNTYSNTLMQKAWEHLKQSDSCYNDYPKLWVDVETYVTKIKKLSYSELMKLHQVCKNAINSIKEPFKAISAQINQTVAKTKLIDKKDQMSLF